MNNHQTRNLVLELKKINRLTKKQVVSGQKALQLGFGLYVLSLDLPLTGTHYNQLSKQDKIFYIK